MKSKRRSSLADEAGAVFVSPVDLKRLAAAKSLLSLHRVHTRDIVNGKDFLFSGPSEELHVALKHLLVAEHQIKRFLQFDFVQIDQYFLLRITGSKEYQEAIASYFD